MRNSPVVEAIDVFAAVVILEALSNVGFIKAPTEVFITEVLYSSRSYQGPYSNIRSSGSLHQYRSHGSMQQNGVTRVAKAVRCPRWLQKWWAPQSSFNLIAISIPKLHRSKFCIQSFGWERSSVLPKGELRYLAAQHFPLSRLRTVLLLGSRIRQSRWRRCAQSVSRNFSQGTWKLPAHLDKYGSSALKIRRWIL